MSVTLNHREAERILLAEAAAREGSTTKLVDAWRARVMQLGRLCPHGKSETVIAALGTAILAKATDCLVDVYSLLKRGEAENSYSARSLADNVWAKNRARLGVDLGANGANPLNNTPFIGKKRIDEITGVKNQEGWAYFIECLEALKALPSSEEAKQALRGFIVARSRSLLAPPHIDPQAGDDVTVGQLLQLIDGYVAADSEGGRRAQASAAALLDATFGDSNVEVGVINDPDRHAPLDISVLGADGGHVLALEVKDKPVEGYQVTASIERTVALHDARNLSFVAVSKQQRQHDFDSVIQWAAKHGVKVTIFLNWGPFYQACKLLAPVKHDIFEGRVYRRLLLRCAQLRVGPDGLDSLKRAAEKPARSSGVE